MISSVDVARIRRVASKANDPSSRPVRVIPVIKEFEAGSSCLIVPISLESWTTWFALRYLLFARPMLPDEALQSLDLEATHRGPWEVVDDTGHTYEGIGSGGGGDRERWVGDVWFAPELSPDVHTLRLAFPDPGGGGMVSIHIPVEPSL
jgi:hypothetical protein